MYRCGSREGGRERSERIPWLQCIACKYIFWLVSVATLRIGRLSKCHVTGASGATR